MSLRCTWSQLLPPIPVTRPGASLLEPLQVDTHLDYSVLQLRDTPSKLMSVLGRVDHHQDGNHDETASAVTHRDESVELDMSGSSYLA